MLHNPLWVWMGSVNKVADGGSSNLKAAMPDPFIFSFPVIVFDGFQGKAGKN